MASPIEKAAQLVVGSVESVAPDKITILLDIDAPQTTALNTGVPAGFPRINSYVLVPNESGAVVGMISWLGIERSNFPKRTGFKDFDLIDLPYPLRKMTIVPLGTLLRNLENGDSNYKLERGVIAFPSIGDPVLLPTEIQLKAIVETQGPDRRVQIGISPLANNATITIDPDKLFGRHVAVLGNTGSGKSCSVAGLIRWSLTQASLEREKNETTGAVNARFIILDPNGEYLKSFSDFKNQVRVFQVPPVTAPTLPLSLPAWMWNSQEWSAFAAAAPGTQRPLLMQGLRNMRSSTGATTDSIERRLRRHFNARLNHLRGRIGQGPSGYTGFPENLRCGELLQNIVNEVQLFLNETSGETSIRLSAVVDAINAVIARRRWVSGVKSGFNDFDLAELTRVATAMDALMTLLPVTAGTSPRSEDAPIPFHVSEFADHLDVLGTEQSGSAQFIAWLTMRIRMMLADSRLAPIVNPESSVGFEKWLEDYVGANNAENGQISILDLSLIPSDVLHIVIAVIARIIFESAQRYRRLYGNELPTVLVLEEAHHFIQHRLTDEGNTINAAQMCKQTFERIAREGRKFGLGLVLSSQRPSELSQTVLAQCNTFLLHRIVNDKDQELVAKLVPDNLGGLLKELPSLPSRQAILLGWVTPLPVLVDILELPLEHRPNSADPKFWGVWTGEEERPIDWKKIADDWISS